MLTAHIRLC